MSVWKLRARRRRRRYSECFVTEPLGVGAIRVFSTRMSQASEEVIEMLPDRRLAYILLSRLSFQDYRAEVNLLPGPMRGSSACREGDFLLDGHEARTVPAERT